MWCVAELDEEYIEKMEDVLKTYEKPYNPAEPVVCLDEKPVSLHADVRPPQPAAPGKLAKRDNEYERRGTANVFCAVEPQAGKHFIGPTPDRSAAEFARISGELTKPLSVGQNDPSGARQPEYSLPQVVDGLLGRSWRQIHLELSHAPLHAQARKLVESG